MTKHLVHSILKYHEQLNILVKDMDNIETLTDMGIFQCAHIATEYGTSSVYIGFTSNILFKTLGTFLS